MPKEGRGVTSIGKNRKLPICGKCIISLGKNIWKRNKRKGFAFHLTGEVGIGRIIAFWSAKVVTGGRESRPRTHTLHIAEHFLAMQPTGQMVEGYMGT